MKLKITMKVGDEVHVLDEESSKRFGGSEQGMEQLLQAKGMLTAVMGMMDTMQPDKVGKRIEMILEFPDGQYIVIGRKPTEDPNFGT